MIVNDEDSRNTDGRSTTMERTEFVPKRCVVDVLVVVVVLVVVLVVAVGAVVWVGRIVFVVESSNNAEHRGVVVTNA